MSKKTNVTGLILLFAGTVIIGCIMSAVYLLIQPHILGLSMKLGIIMPILFGIGAGFLSGKMIGFFKIENVVAAGIVVAIGCLCFSYFKWGLYLANDYGDFLKNEDAEDFLGLCEYADENFADPLHKPYSESSIKDILADMGDEYTYFGDTREEAAENISALMNDDSWYGYYCDLRDSDWNDPSAVYYMSRPAAMFSRIRQINIEGRWEFSGNTVSGVLYALAWFVEFLLMCVPAVYMAIKGASNVYVIPKVPKGEVGSVAVRDVFIGESENHGSDMGSVGYTAPYVPPTMQTSSAVETPDAPDTADFSIPEDGFNFTETKTAFAETAPESESAPEPEVNFDNFDDFFKINE